MLHILDCFFLISYPHAAPPSKTRNFFTTLFLDTSREVLVGNSVCAWSHLRKGLCLVSFGLP